eukprot:1993561-Alexandrium_andersonii.AAC.1
MGEEVSARLEKRQEVRITTFGLTVNDEMVSRKASKAHSSRRVFTFEDADIVAALLRQDRTAGGGIF